jgi:hypothetical protein
MTVTLLQTTRIRGGGLWIARITGIGFIILGMLSSTGAISLPSDPMSDSSNSGDSDIMMSMDMASSSSSDID